MFSTFIPLFAFPTVLFPFQLIFIYKSSLSASIQFCVSILSFLQSQHIGQLYFHYFMPQLTACFSFVFKFVLFWQFCSGRHNFWFPLFTKSIYCTLFLLDCFNFAYGCICICVYSVTLFIVAINFCLYIAALQFCGVLLLLLFYFFHFSPLSYNFDLKKTIIFFLHLFLCLIFLLFSPLALNLQCI